MGGNYVIHGMFFFASVVDIVMVDKTSKGWVLPTKFHAFITTMKTVINVVKITESMMTTTWLNRTT